MAKTWKDADISLDPIKDQTIAVIGYGIQGDAQANNMKDSGLKVIVGLREGSPTWNKAKEDGHEVMSVADATKQEDIDQILPPPPPKMPKDPALENIDAISGKPFQAYPGQDHRAHITAHLNFMATNLVRNNPPIMGALQKNILEHISLMAMEQIQVEFSQEMMMIPQLQQAAPMNPQVAQQLQQMQQTIEARKAVLIAEMTEEFMKEEKAITSQFDHDPLLKLKSREIDSKLSN